ncbi:MAG: hypothetical protein ACQGVK_05795 [Myxococcota bacterium]
MPVLPLIDLLILVGWTTISIGAVLKAIYVSTSYRPTFLGLGPLDLLLVAGCALLFALALAARTWVKANEPGLLAARRRLARLQERRLDGGGHPDFVDDDGLADEGLREEAIPSVGRR